MVSRRTRVASWIFRRDHPSRPKAMICCFFSSFKTFAMLREATYPPAVVNVLDISSESMAAFQVFLYGRFWVFTEVLTAKSVSFEDATEDVRKLLNRISGNPDLCFDPKLSPDSNSSPPILPTLHFFPMHPPSHPP